MERKYDLSKAFRNTERAERLRKNGCTIQVTREEDGKEVVVEEYFVSPEEMQIQAQLRKCRRIQG